MDCNCVIMNGEKRTCAICYIKENPIFQSEKDTNRQLFKSAAVTGANIAFDGASAIYDGASSVYNGTAENLSYFGNCITRNESNRNAVNTACNYASSGANVVYNGANVVYNCFPSIKVKLNY